NTAELERMSTMQNLETDALLDLASGNAPLLFSPISLRGVTVRNRIMLSPMAQYSAIDGFVNDWHFTHLAKMAVGGAGLVFVETSKIERRGLGSTGDIGIWSDDHIPSLKRIARFIQTHG